MRNKGRYRAARAAKNTNKKIVKIQTASSKDSKIQRHKNTLRQFSHNAGIT